MTTTTVAEASTTRTEALTRFRLVVAYHGAPFVGWQVQPNGRSIQAELESALATLLGHPVRVEGSGRTDAGVHALGQVCAFSTHVARTTKAIRDGLNARLPSEIACVEAHEAPLDFDPRRHAKRKLYRYTWLIRSARSPLHADRAWHVRREVDMAAMGEAAQRLVGTHDVASFRAVGCSAATTVRTIEAARIVPDEPLLHFEIEGTGFLRHMVRIVAGTLLEVGHGRRSVQGFADALTARSRDAAGRTAPAHGLTLVSVTYDGQ